MDIVTYAMAKAYTDEKVPFGSEVTEGVITFNGDLTGWEHYAMEDSTLIKVADDVPKADELIGSTCVYQLLYDNGVERGIGEYTIAADDIMSNPMSETGYMHIIFEKNWNITPIMMFEEEFQGIPKGTYFVWKNAIGEQKFYTISLSCLTSKVETIKTIDPKYLPGVCLPVVELSTALNLESTEPIILTEAEGAQFDVANESAIIAKIPCPFGDTVIYLTIVMSKFSAMYSGFFSLGADMYSVILANEGVWAMMLNKVV